MSSRPRKKDPARALRAPKIAADLPASEELTPQEQQAMRRHLRFLAENRAILRLKLNANEDLMINGAREPTHRGQCLHLLGKVDRPSVEAAIDRLSDPSARRRLLEGVLRFSDDEALLLAWLESLTETSSRRAAAAGLNEAVGRIDFEALSDARLRRLLDVVASTFEGFERAQALFGLLHSPSFRAAFERVVPLLADDLQAAFGPLLAVHEVVIEGGDTERSHRELQEGAALLLTAPPDALRAFPPDTQLRLLESAVSLLADEGKADQAAGILLEGIPRDSDEFRRLALARAGNLLRRGAEPRAKWLLKQLRNAQPKSKEAAAWMEALSAARIAHFALGWPGKGMEKGTKFPSQPGLIRAFSLGDQRRVWLRVGTPAMREAFAVEGSILGRMPMLGMAPFLESGVAKGGQPWIAFAAVGQPAAEVLGPRLATQHALDACLQLTGLLHSLGAAGIRLPDARAKRFVVERGRLMLADLSKAELTEPAAALKAHSGPGFGFCRELLRGRDLPPELGRALTRRRSRLSELHRALVMATT